AFAVHLGSPRVDTRFARGFAAWKRSANGRNPAKAAVARQYLSTSGLLPHSLQSARLARAGRAFGHHAVLDWSGLAVDRAGHAAAVLPKLVPPLHAVCSAHRTLVRVCGADVVQYGGGKPAPGSSISPTVGGSQGLACGSLSLPGSAGGE